jgi:long-chain acyl-CoA synthetase
MSAVSEEKETMSETDEAVLFGDEASSSTSSVKYPSRQRHTSRTGNLLEATNAKINPLDHSTQNPLINKLNSIRATLTNCPSMWAKLAEVTPKARALFDEHLCADKVDLTFEQANLAVQKSASIFRSLGITKGTHVSILGENSAIWLLVDHGIQLAGGVSAVRGADAPVDELRYIYEHSDSAGVAVLQGPRLLQRLANDAAKRDQDDFAKTGPLGLHNKSHGSVKTVILMHREKKSTQEIEEMGAQLGLNVFLFQDLLDAANPIQQSDIPEVGKEDVATIVYTSGTTGQPKGVMLTHGNLLHQTGHRLAPTKQYDDSEPLPGDCMLSLLPVWHITERAFELWMLTRGCNVVYSSIRTFKKDLAQHKPEFLVLVPRVLEKVAMGVQNKFADGSAVVKTLVKLFTATSGLRSKHSKISQGLVVGEDAGAGQKMMSKLILTALAPLNAVGDKIVWKKVQEGFGGENKVIISGGSALPGSLETFYENCGMTICVGYGLTECAPLISHRRSDQNLVTGGCVGQPCVDTELRVVDPELKPDELSGERPALPAGEIGVVVARGPQIMKGYYKNPEATAKAVDRFGFFDTGDLGRINPATGDLILTGRCKDTIVLSNGENIEPQPIEDAILGQTAMIEQILLTGQDGRSLTAILMLNPDELVNAGYLDKKTGKMLQKENEKVNDPKCTEEECAASSAILNEAGAKLRKNSDLLAALKSDVREATKDFRKWEQVGNLHITLEPFAMSNGLLTQSYKVKRDVVASRYENEL